MGPVHDAPVVASDDHAVIALVDTDGPGPLQQVDATLGEVGFEHSRHLRVLLREDLLSAHDQGDLAPQGGEHVHELHAGDTGADDHQMVGEHFGGIGVPSGE